jgi:uncharacterized protein YggE
MKKLFLLTAAVLMFSLQVFAQSAIEPPLITVSGQAEVWVPPDEVVFTLGVESVDKDISAAQKRTDDSVKAVFAIATRNNVKPEDVQTSYISVQPKYNTDDVDYEQRRTLKREFVGYQVSKTVAVRLREISRFDSMLSDVLKAGVTRLSNVEFRDSQLRKHKDQARSMAMKAAQEKATLMAREIRQSIGPAYSIREGTTSAPYALSNISQNATSSVPADRADNESSAIAPGQISVSAQVTVSFRLN